MSPEKGEDFSESTHLAILHALVVSYEVKMSTLLCGIQPDKYAQMEWISSSVPWVTVPSLSQASPALCFSHSDTQHLLPL